MGTASAAAAHATLVSTSPSQSAHFAAHASPSTVTVTFDDNVTKTPQSIGVYDGSGRAVKALPAPTPTEKSVAAKLPTLASGSYVVVWHIVSDDGHPEQGAFTFSVGAATAATADIHSLLASRTSGRGMGIAFGVDRALEFFACLVFIGGVAFARWRWPTTLARRDVRRLLFGAAALGFASTLLSIPLQAAYSSGRGTAALVDGSALRNVIDARFGVAALVRAGLIAVLAGFVAVGVRRRGVARIAAETPVALIGVGGAASFGYASHGFTGRWPAFGLALDITHVGAAALWLGGLVVLCCALRTRTDAAAAAQALRRFSQLALPAIALVVVSGTLQGWRQIGTWSALWHTSYARLLIIKVLIVLAIVVIASASRAALRDLGPARRRPPSAAPPAPGPESTDFGGQLVAAAGTRSPRGTLWAMPAAVDLWEPATIDMAEPDTPDDLVALRDVRRGVLLEAGLAVGILAVTSVLVVTPPSREVEVAAKVPQAQTAHLQAKGRTVGYAVAVQPTLAGPNTIVVTPRLLGRTGLLPTSLTGSVQVSGASARTRLTFTPLANGRWVAVAPLPQAGTWTVQLNGATPPTTESAQVHLTVR